VFFQKENDIWIVSIENREERPVTALTGRSGWLTGGLATDGHYLYFCWSDPRMAIWVADLVQPLGK
jgi:hypothetical protein